MLKRISSHTFVLLGMFILLNSCKKEYESIQSIDDRVIEDYIKNNNITAIQDPLKTGFYYQIENPGTGDLFTNTDTVLYDYTIKSLSNGTVYYSPSTISNLGTRVGYTGQFSGHPIPAIRTAILGLKPGGKARIFLPSYLAFGKNGVNNTSIGINVPSNENIELTVTTYPEIHQSDLDKRKIEEFIAEKGLTTAEKEQSGVYYVVVQPGISPGPGTEVIYRTSSVKVKYTGRFLNGTQFDSNSDGVSFVLAELTANWDALTKFTKGAKVRLLIPSGQAYGTSGSSAIPPNAILDFDIEIVDVTN